MPFIFPFSKWKLRSLPPNPVAKLQPTAAPRLLPKSILAVAGMQPRLQIWPDNYDHGPRTARPIFSSPMALQVILVLLVAIPDLGSRTPFISVLTFICDTSLGLHMSTPSAASIWPYLWLAELPSADGLISFPWSFRSRTPLPYLIFRGRVSPLPRHSHPQSCSREWSKNSSVDAVVHRADAIVGLIFSVRKVPDHLPNPHLSDDTLPSPQEKNRRQALPLVSIARIVKRSIYFPTRVQGLITFLDRPSSALLPPQVVHPVAAALSTYSPGNPKRNNDSAGNSLVGRSQLALALTPRALHHRSTRDGCAPSANHSRKVTAFSLPWLYSPD